MSQAQPRRHYRVINSPMGRCIDVVATDEDEARLLAEFKGGMTSSQASH